MPVRLGTCVGLNWCAVLRAAALPRQLLRLVEFLSVEVDVGQEGHIRLRDDIVDVLHRTETYEPL